MDVIRVTYDPFGYRFSLSSLVLFITLVHALVSPRTLFTRQPHSDQPTRAIHCLFYSSRVHHASRVLGHFYFHKK